MFDIIGALMGYINADPKFKTNDFEQAVQYVLSHGVTKEELFADFDPKVEFEEEESKWNEEYYSFARVYLKDNFCEKRINHVKAIARKLYPIVAPVQKTAAPARPTQTGGSQLNGKKSQSQQREAGRKSLSTPSIKIIIAVVVAVALLALVIGLIMIGKNMAPQGAIYPQQVVERLENPL